MLSCGTLDAPMGGILDTAITRGDALDLQGGVMIIDEVGAWLVEQGRTVVTRRTIGLTSATRFNTFIRVNVPAMRRPRSMRVTLVEVR